MIIGYLTRIVSVVLAVLAARWLAHRFGVWPGVAAWSVFMGVGCGVAAWLLHTSGVGKISWKNRVAGVWIPWGAMLGCNQLWSLTLASWLVWSLIGASAIYQGTFAAIATATVPTTATHPHLVSALLFTAWVIDGALFLYVLGIAIKQAHARAHPALITILGILVALILGSVALLSAGHPILAALLAGGPPLTIGLAYGGFLLAVLTFGRNTRWN